MTHRWVLRGFLGLAFLLSLAVWGPRVVVRAQVAPFLVNWPDRRPIARWILGDPALSTCSNPRAYWRWADLDTSDHAMFLVVALDGARLAIERMNAMHPRPQGILIWDLEGQEFEHPLSYIGNPQKLAELAPEMEYAADQFFAAFRTANYKVGMTLRPSSMLTGATLPATCTTDNHTEIATPNTGMSPQDVFIKTDAAYPNRGYMCTATNTWTLATSRTPYYQTTSDNDTLIYNDLKAKITYAKNRWQATIFYVDSTVYSSGAILNATIFRQLQADFPDILLFPENADATTPDYWGASAPYKVGSAGYLNTPASAKSLYPQSFSLLQTLNFIDLTDATTHAALVQAVREGNILMVDAWYDNPNNAEVIAIYNEACP